MIITTNHPHHLPKNSFLLNIILKIRQTEKKMYKSSSPTQAIERGGKKMNQVPQMISTKDLAYLKDIFEWNLTASKKAYHYYETTTDGQLKIAFEQVYQMHKTICNTILTILKEGESL